ncbi:DUF262 domain-containing protein [Sediminispirochaeta smaragdinae]|uniref:GmrSD restriction endonucleases N-terminal domain-containing protein n=1 Tax=Sediminispirochaeta smaragdinae (strain DSM 11293 / JCM 15392 / SEBR 4228) TaxID=573413 RepID=E1R6V7_SEDSS|nr:DUF262 domain-containing protein [Sediminispirochaeta smaragdinae]ADK81284.1 protein of unknown function DUF262 [Sediminispirochaeta smaragdinae DSM 11293]
MKIIRNTMNIADLYKYYTDEELIINKEYQRERGLWPNNSRSFFIDTIIKGFPFPKITLLQKIDLKTKRSIREIIDGQQRCTSIIDFIDNKFKLSKISSEYPNIIFSELSDDDKSNFLSYEISVDTAVGASRDEVIEIFRRINSYTLPLNKPEQRHATYQGYFKWFIKDVIERYTPILEDYKILSQRDISRMIDADLFTELCQLIIEGIVTRSVSKLDNLYKINDKDFIYGDEIKSKLFLTLDFIKTELKDLLEKELLSGFNFYSLFAALLYNNWGIKNINSEIIDGLLPIGKFCNNTNESISEIINMLSEVDEKVEDGEYSEFVKSSLKTTHSVSNRINRTKFFIKALQKV